MIFPKEFQRCVSLGIFPSMRHYFLEEEFQGWEEEIQRIYFDIRQLFWNSLYVEDKDEKDVLRYQLEESALTLLHSQRLLLRYKKYAITYNFEIRIATLQALTSLYHKYSQALGIMY